MTVLSDRSQPEKTNKEVIKTSILIIVKETGRDIVFLIVSFQVFMNHSIGSILDTCFNGISHEH